jgi:hypothetical protein
MNFELTISGLNIIAVNSNEAKPTKPNAIDVIAPYSEMHRPRLAFLPNQFIPDDPDTFIMPELVADVSGARIASEDAAKGGAGAGFYEIRYVSSSGGKEFAMHWGPPKYDQPWSEEWMDWIPSLDDLGFKPLVMGGSGTLPDGAVTRLTLPPGELICREMTRDADTDAILVWTFPSASAGPLNRALANLVAYRVNDIDSLEVWRDGKRVLYANVSSVETVQMNFSNDMAMVMADYNDPQTTLDHLQDLHSVAEYRVPWVAPSVVQDTPQQTGHPICNQSICVYGD